MALLTIKEIVKLNFDLNCLYQLTYSLVKKSRVFSSRDKIDKNQSKIYTYKNEQQVMFFVIDLKALDKSSRVNNSAQNLDLRYSRASILSICNDNRS